jgi:hypothetical protein
MYGFPLTRLEATVAIAGAATCRSMGNRVNAKDLIPVFEEKAKPLSYKKGSELFAAWAHHYNSTVKA